MAPSTRLNINIKETGKKNRGGNIKRKKRPNHPPEVINILKKWLQENKDTYPYPSNTEKSKLCELTGLSLVIIYNIINTIKQLLILLLSKYIIFIIIF